MKRKNIFYTQKVRKYKGRYIAVAGNNIVASGTNAIEAFQLAKKILGRKKIEAVYYIPRKEDLLTALCVSLIIK